MRAKASEQALEFDLDAIPEWDRYRFDQATTQQALNELPAAERHWIEKRFDQIWQRLSNPIRIDEVKGTRDEWVAPKPLPFEAASDRRSANRERWKAAVEVEMKRKPFSGKPDFKVWAAAILADADFIAACQGQDITLPDSAVTVARHISRVWEASQPKAARRRRPR